MRLHALIGCAAALLAPLTAALPARAADAGCYVEPASTLPAPPAIRETLNGRETLRYLPPHPKGVVYFFHGSGGSEQFAARVHSQRLLAALVAAGYGYVSPPSLDRDVKRWDLASVDPASNPDVAWVLGLHKALIARGEISSSTPVFTTGMSNGGGFANLFAVAAKLQGLPITAVADYMGPFPASLRPVVTDPKALAPTLLILSRNDGLVSAKQTGAVAQGLTEGGARIETHLNAEHRVCAATFSLVPGLSAADREALVSKGLPGAGLVDAEGRRKIFMDDPVISRDDMAELYAKLPGEQGRLIANELLIAWAGHQMRSDYAERQVTFFNEALAGADKPSGR